MKLYCKNILEIFKDHFLLDLKVFNEAYEVYLKSNPKIKADPNDLYYEVITRLSYLKNKLTRALLFLNESFNFNYFLRVDDSFFINTHNKILNLDKENIFSELLKILPDILNDYFIEIENDTRPYLETLDFEIDRCKRNNYQNYNYLNKVLIKFNNTYSLLNDVIYYYKDQDDNLYLYKKENEYNNAKILFSYLTKSLIEIPNSYFDKNIFTYFDPLNDEKTIEGDYNFLNAEDRFNQMEFGLLTSLQNIEQVPDSKVQAEIILQALLRFKKDFDNLDLTYEKFDILHKEKPLDPYINLIGLYINFDIYSIKQLIAKLGYPLIELFDQVESLDECIYFKTLKIYHDDTFIEIINFFDSLNNIYQAYNSYMTSFLIKEYKNKLKNIHLIYHGKDYISYFDNEEFYINFMMRNYSLNDIELSYYDKYLILNKYYPDCLEFKLFDLLNKYQVNDINDLIIKHNILLFEDDLFLELLVNSYNIQSVYLTEIFDVFRYVFNNFNVDEFIKIVKIYRENCKKVNNFMSLNHFLNRLDIYLIDLKKDENKKFLKVVKIFYEIFENDFVNALYYFPKSNNLLIKLFQITAIDSDFNSMNLNWLYDMENNHYFNIISPSFDEIFNHLVIEMRRSNFCLGSLKKYYSLMSKIINFNSFTKNEKQDIFNQFFDKYIKEFINYYDEYSIALKKAFENYDLHIKPFNKEYFNELSYFDKTRMLITCLKDSLYGDEECDVVFYKLDYFKLITEDYLSYIDFSYPNIKQILKNMINDVKDADCYKYFDEIEVADEGDYILETLKELILLIDGKTTC